ncbi:MAG: DUF502 domain-containing protein [Phycisphaerales bacterium]|nr:DUF502 domain-containing protein [Phycisphaerales bacterium]
MTEHSKRTFGSDFKRFFLRGLAILLPTVLTLWLVVYAYRFLDSAIASPINAGIRVAIGQATPYWTPLHDVFDPPASAVREEIETIRRSGKTPPSESAVQASLRQRRIEQWWEERWYLNLVGLAAAIIGVYMAGRLLGGFLGRRMYARVEQFLVSVPVFKQVYPYVKQVVDFLVAEDKPIKFNRVVAVEYPRKGVWSIGLVTGGPMSHIRKYSGDSVTLFIPSSPTPFTGYTITVPRSEVRELPITIDQALRFVVSGGVLVPEGRSVEKAGDAPSGGASDPDSLSFVALPSTAVSAGDPGEERT